MANAVSSLERTMNSLKPAVSGILVSGRELFVCDHFFSPAVIADIAAFVKTLPYERRERARLDMEPTASSADIPPSLDPAAGFLAQVKSIAEEMFPGEPLLPQRAYVNHSVYGDIYHMHRDWPAGSKHVTALYYANAAWEPDWGGETIFFNDANDAEVVVSPRPGRLVVSRGAILHRGTVPTRDCTVPRFTLAYKLFASR